jgi:uncharacterized protein (DUF433 family)
VQFSLTEQTDRLLARITRDRRVLVGKPVIRGMRISVEQLQAARKAGITEEELIDDYPELEPLDFRAIERYTQLQSSNPLRDSSATPLRSLRTPRLKMRNSRR